MCRARRRGPPSTTTDANLNCAFVENALFYLQSLIVKSQLNRIESVTRLDVNQINADLIRQVSTVLSQTMAASSTLAAAANGHQHQRGSEQLPQRKAPPYQPPPVNTATAAATPSQPQSMHSIASNGGGIGGGISAGSNYQPTATQVGRQLTDVIFLCMLYYIVVLTKGHD